LLVEKNAGTYGIESYVPATDEQNVLDKRKMSFPYQDLKPGPPSL
jgi:hypothetical protein